MIRNDFILDFNDIISSGFHAVFRLKEFGTPWGNFSQQSSVFPVARVVVVNRSISGVVCRLVMISASTLLVWICRFKHNFLHLHSAWTPPPSLRGLHTIFLLDAFCPQSSNLSRCSSFAHNFADQSNSLWICRFKHICIQPDPRPLFEAGFIRISRWMSLALFVVWT